MTRCLESTVGDPAVVYTCGDDGRFSTTNTCTLDPNIAPPTVLSACDDVDCGDNSICVPDSVDPESEFVCACSSGYGGLTIRNGPAECTETISQACAEVYCGPNAVCAEPPSSSDARFICACRGGYGGHAVDDGIATCSPLCDGSLISAPSHTVPAPTGTARQREDQEP